MPVRVLLHADACGLATRDRNRWERPQRRDRSTPLGSRLVEDHQSLETPCDPATCDELVQRGTVQRSVSTTRSAVE